MSNFDTEQEEYPMSYVINIEDGAGREYFIGENGTAIALDAKNAEKPMIFKTDKQIIKKRDALEAEYPPPAQYMQWNVKSSRRVGRNS